MSVLEYVTLISHVVGLVTDDIIDLILPDPWNMPLAADICPCQLLGSTSYLL